jgi:type I restriction enzyme S subunit
VKPGYKQTEVGVIPTDWQVEQIERLAEITTGSRNTQDRIDDGAYPFFVRSQTVERIDSYSFDGEAVLTAGDGVGTGKVFHYINGRFDAHQRVYRIARFSERMQGYFFFLYFSSNFYGRIMQMTAKSSVDSVRREMIARMLVPVPPLPEQRAIAEALSDVDGLLGGMDRLIAKKRDLKQAAMQQLLTAQTRLPGFLGEWETKTFGEVFDYLPTATNSRSDLTDDEDTFYIHYGDIHTRFHNHLDFTQTQPPRINRARCRNAALLKNGDWVMADASEDYDGVGKSIEILGLDVHTNAISGLHTFLLREKTPTFAPGYKGHLGNLKSLHEQFLKVATGMKVYGVSKTALKNLELSIPPLPEQTAIAEVLSEMDAELAALEARRAKTRALKQAMMHQLLTGQIRLI